MEPHVSHKIAVMLHHVHVVRGQHDRFWRVLVEELHTLAGGGVRQCRPRVDFPTRTAARLFRTVSW